MLTKQDTTALAAKENLPLTSAETEIITEKINKTLRSLEVRENAPGGFLCVDFNKKDCSKEDCSKNCKEDSRKGGCHD